MSTHRDAVLRVFYSQQNVARDSSLRSLTGCTFNLFDGTVMERTGYMPILHVKITFVIVSVTESLGVDGPLHKG